MPAGAAGARTPGRRVAPAIPFDDAGLLPRRALEKVPRRPAGRLVGFFLYGNHADREKAARRIAAARNVLSRYRTLGAITSTMPEAAGWARVCLGGYMDELNVTAQESLDILKAIADAAGEKLRTSGLKPSDLANPNQMTSPGLMADMQNRNRERTSNLQELRRKPAIARLVIADEHNNRETFYVALNAEIDIAGTKICSYLANRGKGRLIARPVGDGDYVDLPSGRRYFDVVEKLTFEPRFDSGDWDSRPAVQFREKAAPRTIRSLRELFRRVGIDDDAFDLEEWVSADEDEQNIKDGIRRETLISMELRLNPYLDLVQEKIFRLPLDSRIAVFGPPGTGKTTTLVRRLRQKIDFAALDPEEAELIARPDAAGRSHPESWLMFTPTELLRQYVIGALNREGVPAPDDRLKTWNDYRLELGKRLRILPTVGRSGLIMNPDLQQLQPRTLAAMTEWYGAFDAHQRATFVAQLRAEGERIAATDDIGVAALGRQVLATIDRNGDSVLQLLAELLAIRDQLRVRLGDLRSKTQDELGTIVSGLRNSDPEILAELETFVAELLREQEDSTDEPDEDDDDDEGTVSPGERARGRKAVRDVFLRALRTTAIARANSRKPASSSRTGRVLAWLQDRGSELPDMKELGRTLLVQRAIGRILRAPADYLGRMSLRYRAFRRDARADGNWYRTAKVPPAHAHSIEIDVILLATLRASQAMEADRLISRRLGDDVPALMQDVARERRNQILVDEATDFSPIQLACMRALADRRTGSLFLSGDFNQRLTSWGSRSEADLHFVDDTLIVERISVTYRQSRKLAEFAVLLTGANDEDSAAAMPEYSSNIGVDPVVGLGLGDTAAQACWLAARIREIVDASNGVMPTIAVLMPDEDALDDMADALTEELRPVSIKACAYRSGVARGLDQDIRVFSVEHIKGLEFEAVFFVNIDRLAERETDLFGRYLYVGATRAATYLGLTVSGGQFPAAMEPVAGRVCQNW